MENFKALYLEYCKTYNADPQEAVRSELKRLSLVDDETSRTLNLSSHHLTDKTCMILSKLLSKDQRFICLKLNDCSLSKEAIRDICHAMMTNNSIITLELKGNNIHDESTECLAKMLRQNTTIKSLSLEWNSLGIMSSNAFPEFCQSLGMNKSLKDLDLRNNQITHTSALELCTAIEANMTLQNLDLRWNNIGLVGGKGLLTSLKKNHTLMLLQIAGNNIPEDICEAIALKMGHNTEQVKVAKEYNSRTAVLANELSNVQFQKEKQVNILLSKIDLQEEAVRKTNRAMSEKMKKLQNALEDRMGTMNAMTSKLSIAEADLALSEQKCLDLQHTLQKLQFDKENDLKTLSSKSKREKDDLLSEKLKLERELNDSLQRQSQLDDKLKETERKCQELQLAAYEAKEKLAQGQAEYQIKMVVLDDEVRRLKQKHKDELKELESNKSREIERLKADFELVEKSYKDRINKLENLKHTHEEEINRLKATLGDEKLAHDQQIHELRVKAQLEDNQRRKELEDRVRILQASKDDMVMENNKLNAKMVDQQQKQASSSLEIETLKRNNDSLRNQVHEKEMEILSNSEKLKTDYEKRIRSVQKEIDRCDEYKDKVHDLELKLKKSEAEHQISIKTSQMENDSLKAKVKSLEETMGRFREEISKTFSNLS